MEVRRHRAETNGVRLHYVIAGSGPVVLGMHGWPQSHREYLRIIERFADRYRFIVPDLRGFADSDKPFRATSRRRSPGTCWSCSRPKASTVPHPEP